jgi:hypothetical protein
MKDGDIILCNDSASSIVPPLGSEEEYEYEFIVSEPDVTDLLEFLKYNHGVFIDLIYKDSYNEEDRCWHKSSYHYHMYEEEIGDERTYVVDKILSHHYIKNVSYDTAVKMPPGRME